MGIISIALGVLLFAPLPFPLWIHRTGIAGTITANNRWWSVFNIMARIWTNDPISQNQPLLYGGRGYYVALAILAIVMFVLCAGLVALGVLMILNIKPRWLKLPAQITAITAGAVTGVMLLLAILRGCAFNSPSIAVMGTMSIGFGAIMLVSIGAIAIVAGIVQMITLREPKTYISARNRKKRKNRRR